MTMDPHDLDRPDLPLYGPQPGTVLDRADPRQLGRVRVTIPGLVEQGTGWALPMGTVGGGEQNRGFFAVPEEGAEVVVFFRGGNVDQPYYICSNWGAPGGSSDVPESARDKGVDVTPNIRVFETDKFEMVFDDNEQGEFRVKHKTTEAEISIDGTTGAISIKALGNLSLEATGQVSIEGLVVSINGVAAGSGSL
jgi:uncharacterized protein involved in type VI secretion and phage assembly